MFDDIQNRLSNAFGRFRGRGLLTEANIREGLREVRTALLEADVNYNVVQEFMGKVTEQAVGQQVVKSVRPDQQIVKIVHDELVELMGPTDPSIRFAEGRADDPDALRPPGLGQDDDLRQAGPAAGVAGPQAAARRRRPPAPGGRRAAQGHRPAASDPGLQRGRTRTRSGSARTAWPRPTARAATPIILDTAGRLHIDDELMAELKQIEKKVKPAPGLFRLRRHDRPGRRRQRRQPSTRRSNSTA